MKFFLITTLIALNVVLASSSSFEDFNLVVSPSVKRTRRAFSFKDFDTQAGEVEFSVDSSLSLPFSDLLNEDEVGTPPTAVNYRYRHAEDDEEIEEADEEIGLNFDCDDEFFMVDGNQENTLLAQSLVRSSPFEGNFNYDIIPEPLIDQSQQQSNSNSNSNSAINEPFQLVTPDYSLRYQLEHSRALLSPNTSTFILTGLKWTLEDIKHFRGQT